MRTIPLLVILLFVFLGCDSVGPEGSDIQFETSESLYNPGDQVSVTLDNNTASQLGLNLCFAFLTLERRTDSRSWEQVPVGLGPDENTFCTAIMHHIPPGSSSGGVAFLPDDLSAGTYRITTRLEIDGEPTQEETNTFEVMVAETNQVISGTA